ncbi:hypothetical protein [Flavobacterium suzhouense]|uniref:Uncharacterized protein n=1 Tax=Flavobacterium suzhouense TaxID=1529638 RepID=A0ABW5NZ58_9FLAO
MENKDDNVIQPNFRAEINTFIKHIEAQADIVPLVMKLLSVKRVQESKHVQKFIKENGLIEEGSLEDEDDNDPENSKSEKTVKLVIPPEKIKVFLELTDVVETTNLAYSLLPINFVVSFVSQYDSYLGGLIRTMFVAQPELLNYSEKNILFSELIKFTSINEAREFIVEKEVESVLRESHLKQFKWLENKLNIPLRKDLPSFSDFIEVTERRNLFVHCNGIVSRQYLEVCRENGVVNSEKNVIGEKLTAEPDYFSKCYEVLFEIGVKLGHVIWRKLRPDDLLEADVHLNEVCYQLLNKGHYTLAINLLKFATDTLRKHHDQEIVCVFTVNKALAYYLSDNREECTKVLNAHDWSATNDKFKLAIHILRENYESVLDTMRSIGDSNKHITKDSYREWPLFSKLRKRDDFKEVYKDIFKEDFIYLESKPNTLEDILSEMNKSNHEEKIQKVNKISNEVKKATPLKKATPVKKPRSA